MVKIAVLGHGVVGSGVVESIELNSKRIEEKATKKIQVKYILDIRDFDNLPYKDKFVKDFSIIENDPEISIVAEVMGGVDPAFDFVKRCLKKGKSVVTSNKELVAAKGAELLQIAKEHDVNLFFEASVGGGIPIIRPMHQCLAANEIKEVYGILNGTTNFILTKMVQEGMDFYEALALAQQLGYAEKDPSADVLGHDASRKICILASLAFGRHVYPKYVYAEGITALTLQDVAYANEQGYKIKLIGQARLEGDKVVAFVAPAFVPNSCLLSNVTDVFNAVLVRGNIVGDVLFYGRGAGKMPTASAVVADIIDAAKHTGTLKAYGWQICEDNIVVPQEKVAVRYYIRANDTTREIINNIFGNVQYISKENIAEQAFFSNTDIEKVQCERIEQLESMGAKILGAVRVLDI